MYEYHGWATLSESPSEFDDGHFEPLAKSIRNEIRRIRAEHGGIDIGEKTINGLTMVWVAGYANHRRPDADEVHNLFRLIAKQLPGSYGLLYERDDEDTQGYENDFCVWRLARGQLVERRDVLLSPCIPTIEDN